jgi:hypothetical protein
MSRPVNIAAFLRLTTAPIIPYVVTFVVMRKKHRPLALNAVLLPFVIEAKGLSKSKPLFKRFSLALKSFGWMPIQWQKRISIEKF